MDKPYAIEWNGEFWQSVFPEAQSERSQLHTTAMDALRYLCDECEVCILDINIVDNRSKQ